METPKPIEQPYHAIILRGRLERLELLATFAGGLEGIDIEVPPFVVDSGTQVELIPLVASLNCETIKRGRREFAAAQKAVQS